MAASSLKLNIFKSLSVKKLTWLLIAIAIAAALGAAFELNRIRQINAFNLAVSTGKTPQTDKLSFEAKYATAYWLAKNERYKESSLLFLQLAEKGVPAQLAAVQHNLGNIFFLRGLEVGGNDARVRDEVEYLLTQAKNAYKQALKQDNSNWGTRRNLDRVISLLPDTPTPSVGDSDSPGLIMGNIPVGLP
jgi:TPR repeat protein